MLWVKRFALIIVVVASITLITAFPVCADGGNCLILKNVNGVIENRTLHNQTAETYAKADRKWQGIPQIAVTDGGRIWCAWFSGGESEPNEDNYIILSYSDNGIDFVDPFIIIDSLYQSKRCFDPILWMDQSSNVLWVWFGMTGEGKYCFRITNPDASPQEIAWTEPVAGTFNSSIHGVLVLDNGDWLFADQVSTSQIRVLASVDQGRTWSVRALVPCNSANKTSHEAQLVQLRGGEIWLMARIDGGARGGIERWISLDNGVSFANNESNLESPLRGPGSKFAIKRLSSGNLLFVNNGSDTARNEIVAYLSEDNGVSWPYSLKLDIRNDVSYPEIAEDDNGLIYVVWDKGRYREKEIRYSCFSENDIRNGFIDGEGKRDRIPVSKTGMEYFDIVSVTPKYERVMRIALGSVKETIIGRLPDTVTIALSDGESLLLTGKWKCPGYDEDKAGIYSFYFQPDQYLPLKYSDTYELLRVNVILEEKESGGCSSSFLPSSAISGAIGVIIVCAYLRIKKYE